MLNFKIQRAIGDSRFLVTFCGCDNVYPLKLQLNLIQIVFHVSFCDEGLCHYENVILGCESAGFRKFCLVQIIGLLSVVSFTKLEVLLQF